MDDRLTATATGIIASGYSDGLPSEDIARAVVDLVLEEAARTIEVSKTNLLDEHFANMKIAAAIRSLSSKGGE